MEVFLLKVSNTLYQAYWQKQKTNKDDFSCLTDSVWGPSHKPPRTLIDHVWRSSASDKRSKHLSTSVQNTKYNSQPGHQHITRINHHY